MEDFWLNWLFLVGLNGLALASPGPDFVIAVRNSILYSRRIGLYTALGFAAGVMVHMTYTIFGIATLIAQSVILFNILKYAGAAYLIYVGVKALMSKGFEGDDPTADLKRRKNKTLSPLKALMNGFVTNVLNPKATLFFLAVFSQFITPETPISVQLIYALTFVIMTAIWFSIVAIVLTQPKIKAAFLRFTKWIDKVCGCLLIALGIKIALTKI